MPGNEQPMTRLKVRPIPFQFGDDTPFQWNPANPFFGLAMNTLSFIAPPFERYIVAGLRQAMPRITEPAVAAEADAFLRQEAQHARAHRLHVAALTRQYPGLAEVSAEIERRFDHLLETQSLEFHLAYAADIEATFTPMFNVWLRHRDSLFDNGDPRVALPCSCGTSSRRSSTAARRTSSTTQSCATAGTG